MLLKLIQSKKTFKNSFVSTRYEFKNVVTAQTKECVLYTPYIIFKMSLLSYYIFLH